MSVRLFAFGFAVLLVGVIASGYVPAFIDQNNMILGLFRRTWYADGLHAVSAVWALIAAIKSRYAARMFFLIFGPLYFLDGVLGLITGSGYLDFGIFIYGVQNLPLTTRFFANLPHLVLGSFAIWVGYIYGRRGL